MATPRASDILGHVTLVTGPEEFLNQRAVTSAVAAVRASDPESELSETTADQVSMAALGDLAAPSLFSSIRCVVVRNLEDLPDDTYDGLLDYAGVTVGGHRAGARALRRPEGLGPAHQAPQAVLGDRGEVRVA